MTITVHLVAEGVGLPPLLRVTWDGTPAVMLPGVSLLFGKAPGPVPAYRPRGMLRAPLRYHPGSRFSLCRGSVAR